MSLSPSIGISKLSLEGMRPPTRSLRDKKRMDSARDGGRRESQEEGDDSMDEDDDSTVRSPTKLKYNTERLSPRTRKLVRSLWGESFEEPPEMSLQWCDRKLDADGNVDFYAFQMHEVVPRSVRIGSPKSQYAEPQCQCGAAKPCKHLMWLSDRIAQQALYDHSPQDHLNLSDKGYPEELGEPFQCILDMHLDVLADGLHCEVGHPLARSSPSQQRLDDARSIIASIADVDQHVFDSYRSDLAQTRFDAASLVHHRDAEATLFSLLVASHRLSAWLRSRLHPWDPAQSPFAQIESRARKIIADLDTFLLISPSSPSSRTREKPLPVAAVEGACDVPWAATGLTRCVRQIHNLVSRTEEPLHPLERASAARALVRILRGVVESQSNHHHRGDSGDTPSLYARLIRDRDGGFVADSLELLVDQTQFIDEIEDILVGGVGVRGAPASWVARMQAVVTRMRANRRTTTATPGEHSRASGAGGGRAAAAASTTASPTAPTSDGGETRTRAAPKRQRPVSPALGPVEHGAPGSAAASGVGIGSSAGVGLGIGYGGTTAAAAMSSSAPGESGSASTSGGGTHFLAAETQAGPTSSSSVSRGRGGSRAGRGASGGAGSKRSGAGTGAERGSKRAR